MAEIRKVNRKRRHAVALGGLLATSLLVGCADPAEPDICRDHFTVHGDHAGAVSRLHIELDESGTVEGEFHLADALPASLIDSLRAPGGLFRFEGQYDCNPQFTGSDQGATLRFHARCGPETVVDELRVSVFDTLSELDELVVTVNTPATTKTFAVLRACPSPVFRLQ